MLKIKDLKKSYGKLPALNGLDLEIKKGELFGFVGPNGAGKTTTMRIICGLLRADSGEIYVSDVNARKDIRKLKRKIGYMPDFFGVYDNLKVFEYMEFYASIYGISGKKGKEVSKDLIELVNLSDKWGQYVDELSRGMKQRLCLARCLIHNPDLLILDEPASGLDPRARVEMKEILKKLQSSGKTIIISSHILPELSELCTSIGIIENGKMVISGPVDEIVKTMSSSSSLIIQFVENQEMGVHLLEEHPLIENLSIQDSTVTATFLGDERMEALLLLNLVQKGVLINGFHRKKGNLESVFMQITDSDNRNRGALP